MHNAGKWYACSPPPRKWNMGAYRFSSKRGTWEVVRLPSFSPEIPWQRSLRPRAYKRVLALQLEGQHAKLFRKVCSAWLSVSHRGANWSFEAAEAALLSEGGVPSSFARSFLTAARTLLAKLMFSVERLRSRLSPAATKLRGKWRTHRRHALPGVGPPAARQSPICALLL